MGNNEIEILLYHIFSWKWTAVW